MYATIRRYSPKEKVDQNTVNDLKRRIETGFVPTVQDIRGFHGYYVVNTGNNELLSIGIFEDRNGAAESTRRAAEFVKNDPNVSRLGTPQVQEGELLVMTEAAVAAR